MSTLQPHSNAKTRRGFTLVELLVAIGLISFVAGMFLVAYRGAAAEATNIRTASTIRKISEVLTSRMQEYENVPVGFEQPIPSNAVPAFVATDPRFEPAAVLIARAQLIALREMICLEMPDHPDDIRWTTAWAPPQQVPLTKSRLTGLMIQVNNGFNPVYSQLLTPSRANKIRQRLSVPGSSPLRPDPNWHLTNANAELLYLIVEDSTINGSSALELFGKSEIGDTDNDGHRELLDANRRPIQWLRWPAGFPSVTRYHPDLLDPSLIDPVTRVSRLGHDIFDRMKVDPGLKIQTDADLKSLRPDIGGFPLVISGGTDGIVGVRMELDLNAVAFDTPYGDYTQMPNSRSVCDVLFPTAYGIIPMPDPWYPRPKPPTSSDDFSSLRLGVIVNPGAFQDDITNYDSNGANL